VDDSTDVELSAARFRALGDPTRLRVIRELVAGTCCVCELRDRIDVPGPPLSHHLRVLSDADIVATTRRGRLVDCTRVPTTIAALGDIIEPATGFPVA